MALLCVIVTNCVYATSTNFQFQYDLGGGGGGGAAEDAPKEEAKKEKVNN